MITCSFKRAYLQAVPCVLQGKYHRAWSVPLLRLFTAFSRTKTDSSSLQLHLLWLQRALQRRHLLRSQRSAALRVVLCVPSTAISRPSIELFLIHCLTLFNQITVPSEFISSFLILWPRLQLIFTTSPFPATLFVPRLPAASLSKAPVPSSPARQMAPLVVRIASILSACAATVRVSLPSSPRLWAC